MLRNRIRGSLVPFWARSRALHYLAGSYELCDELRHQLTQVVTAMLAAVTKRRHAPVKWLREWDREIGEISPLGWFRP